MSRPTRAAVVMLTGALPTGACPPGLDPAVFAGALVEDVVDLVADLADVDVALACSTQHRALVEAVRWPGMPVVQLSPGADAMQALDCLAELGYGVGAAVTPDVPDLPGLVLAKPFSALSAALVAAIPAIGGGLVTLAARLPLPDWVRAAGGRMDSEATLQRLRETAPRRRDVQSTPPWHRLRAAGDLRRLDPDLEGWERTRALLTRGRLTG